MMKWFVMAAIMLALGSGYYFVTADTEEGSAKEQRLKTVQVHAVVPQPYEQYVTLNADARANETVMITAQNTDKIERIHFQEGAKVSKGDVLVTLQQESEDASARAAVATLQDAKSQFKRIASLAAQDAISKADYDRAKTAVTVAEAAVKEARTMQKERTIRAPFSGIIGVRQVSEGALVEPATQIAQLDDLSIIKAELHIPERYLALIAEGQQVEARSTAYPEEMFEGAISVIEARLDSASRQFKVIATINNNALLLKAGMLLDVTLRVAQQKVIAIPEEAIIPLASKHYVFVVQDNIAKQIAVTIDRRFDGKVEITNGLSAGDVVVTHGQFTLNEDEQVQILGE